MVLYCLNNFGANVMSFTMWFNRLCMSPQERELFKVIEQCDVMRRDGSRFSIRHSTNDISYNLERNVDNFIPSNNRWMIAEESSPKNRAIVSQYLFDAIIELASIQKDLLQQKRLASMLAITKGKL